MHRLDIDDIEGGEVDRSEFELVRKFLQGERIFGQKMHFSVLDEAYHVVQESATKLVKKMRGLPVSPSSDHEDRR